MNILEIAGLLLNFSGTILIALSVQANPGGANQMVNGKKIPLASIFLNRFRWGIFLLGSGFLLQLFTIIFSN